MMEQLLVLRLLKMENSDSKLSFLYSAIADAQELIRFTDSKTAIATSIIAAIIVGIYSTLEKLIVLFHYFSYFTTTFLGFTIILLIVSIWIIIKIIKPVNNPKSNLDINDNTDFKVKFYLPCNKYKFWYPIINSNKNKLMENFEIYLSNMKSVKDEEIVKILTFELFKVSYIRNIKNDRFNILIPILASVVFTFLVYYIFYLINCSNIPKCILSMKNLN